MTDKAQDKKLLKEAIKYIHIQDVYMHSTSAKVQDDFIPKYNDIPLSVQSFHRPLKIQEISSDEGEFDGKMLQIFITVGSRFIDTGLDDEVLDDEKKLGEHIRAEIKAVFIAEYSVTDTEKCTDECIEVFGRMNAGFHVWPYWREYMQATCTRLKLPPVVFPMYKINDVPPAKKAHPGLKHQKAAG